MVDHIDILDHVIKKILNSEARDLEERIGITIILIGSFQYTDIVNDIDLIIVYEVADYLALKKLKKIIANSIYNIFELPVHYTTLSHNEYIAMKHLHNEKQQIIFKHNTFLDFGKTLKDDPY